MMPPAHVPIYVASLGPANLRLTGELADGWIGNSFFPETADVFLDPIREGAAAAGRDLADLDLTVSVGVEFTDDVEAAGRRHAEGYAFTFGAMGSPTTQLLHRRLRPPGLRRRRRARSSGCGSPATATPPAGRVPTAIGLGTNLIGTDDLVARRGCAATATPASRRCARSCRATRPPTSTANSPTSPACSTSSPTSTTNRPHTTTEKARSAHDLHRHDP